MKNISNSFSLYSWKENSLYKKYKKQMCYEENKSLFSWRREKFFLQKFVTFVMIVDSF